MLRKLFLSVTSLLLPWPHGLHDMLRGQIFVELGRCNVANSRVSGFQKLLICFDSAVLRLINYSCIQKPINDEHLSQAPVAQKLDSAMQRIKRYPVDKYFEIQLRYPLHSNLSSGWHYPPFEQLGPCGWLLIPNETPDKTPPGFHLRWKMFFIWDQRLAF